jgi:hypothetical protein
VVCDFAIRDAVTLATLQIYQIVLLPCALARYAWQSALIWARGGT